MMAALSLAGQPRLTTYIVDFFTCDLSGRMNEKPDDGEPLRSAHVPQRTSPCPALRAGRDFWCVGASRSASAALPLGAAVGVEGEDSLTLAGAGVVFAVAGGGVARSIPKELALQLTGGAVFAHALGVA